MRQTQYTNKSHAFLYGINECCHGTIFAVCRPVPGLFLARPNCRPGQSAAASRRYNCGGEEGVHRHHDASPFEMLDELPGRFVGKGVVRGVRTP